jgi:two-component system response regulator AlgR
MRVLIADDEPPARARMAALLDGIGDVEIAGEAGDGRATLEAVQRLDPDLVLLDIRMPGMDGLEAARHLLGFERPPAIVFCSACGDHALEAFERSAIDYLLKPIRRERLEAALGKVRRFDRSTMRALEEATPRRRSHLCAHVRGNLLLVPIGEVSHFVADEKYVAVHHAGGTVLIEEPLKDLEEEFGERFVRIHRACLVARDRLGALARSPDGRLLVRIAGVSEPLEVSRRNHAALRRLVRGR